MPLEPKEPVIDEDATRERVSDGERLLDELIEAERLRDTVLLLDTLVVGEGTARRPERVAVVETLAERLTEGLREREGVMLEP